MGSGYTKSLKCFVQKHPPLLLFITCLVVLSLSAITIASMVSRQELPNPDIKTDWNTFLTDLFKWDICKQHDEKTNNIDRKYSTFNDANSRSVMVEMITSWRTSSYGAGIVMGKFYGNVEKESEFLEVTMHFLNSALYNGTCAADSCTVTVPVCLTFTGSVSMLPNTRTPKGCSDNFEPVTNDVIFYEASMSSQTCSEDDLLQTTYVPNPDLTAMLTYRERSIVNVHLMHTGYFMLLVALTLFCSILVRDHFRGSAHGESKVITKEVNLGSVQRTI